MANPPAMVSLRAHYFQCRNTFHNQSSHQGIPHFQQTRSIKKGFAPVEKKNCFSQANTSI
jgi:hypothetical protein